MERRKLSAVFGCILALSLLMGIIAIPAASADEVSYPYLSPFGYIEPPINQPLAERTAPASIAGKNILVLGYNNSGGTASAAANLQTALRDMLIADGATSTTATTLGSIAAAGPATSANYNTWAGNDAVVIAIVDDNVGAYWASYHAKQIESRGTPVVVVVNSPFETALNSGAVKNGFTEMRTAVLEDRLLSRSYHLAAGANRVTWIRNNVLTDPVFQAVTDGITAPLEDAERNPAAITQADYAAIGANDLTVTAANFARAHEVFFDMSMDLGFGDGLPLVIPTPEIVAGLIASSGRGGGEVIGRMFGGGTITVEKVAVNAAMAGVRPEYFPLVLSMMEAYASDYEDQRTFDYALRTSDAQLNLAVVVSGPIAWDLGMISDRYEWGVGIYGSVFEVNSAIGRTLKLCFMNIGHNKPEDTAMRGVIKRFNDHSPRVTAELLYDSPPGWISHSNMMGFEQDGADTNTVSIIPVSLTRATTSVGATITDWTSSTNMTSLRTNSGSAGATTNYVSVLMIASDHGHIWTREQNANPSGLHQSNVGMGLTTKLAFQNTLANSNTNRNRNLVWPMMGGGSPGMSRVFNAGGAPFTVRSYITQLVSNSHLPPSAPQNLTAEFLAYGTSAQLNWDAPARGTAARYDVSVDGGVTWADAGTATELTLNDLAIGGEYQFAVRAVGDVRNSASIDFVSGNAAIVTDSSGRGAWALAMADPPETPPPTQGVSITITAPVAGATPSSTAAIDGAPANYSVGSVTWMPVAATFRTGVRYIAQVTATANPGFSFDPGATATVNGQAATVRSNTGSALTLMYTFPAAQEPYLGIPIASAAVTLTAPAAGGTPNTTAAVPEDANYTASVVTWMPNVSPFRAGVRYIAQVTLTAEAGYVFDARTTASMNGAAATIRANDNATLTIMYTFPAA